MDDIRCALQPPTPAEAGAPGAGGAARPLRLTDPPRGLDLGASAFVWGVWALLAAASLAFVYRYGSSVVFWSDDYSFVPVLTGDEPCTAAWLWEQYGPHRFALGKLVWLAVARLTDGNLRAVLFLNVLIPVVMAAVMIRAARAMRGWVSYSDAFFPLALVSLANFYSFTFSAIIIHTLATIPVITLLVIVARSRTPPTPRAALLAGACLLMLPLCGTGGLTYVPALALWLGYAAVLRWRSRAPHGKRDGLLIAGVAAAALLVLALYFVGYQSESHSDDKPPPPTLRETLKTSVQFLNMGLGGAPSPFWKYTGLAVLALLLFNAAFLVVVWGRWPEERFRAAGLLLFLGSVLALALALGWGRAGYSTGGSGTHYILFAAPALCCVYFLWGAYGTPAVSRLVQMSLFAVLCATFAHSLVWGSSACWAFRRQTEAFEKDLHSGLPPLALAGRHAPSLFPYDTDHMAAGLRMLRKGGVGQYRLMRDDPALRSVPLAVAPTAVSQMTWDEGRKAGRALGSNPYLTFALTEPLFVYAVRLKCSYENATGAVDFRTSWRGRGDDLPDDGPDLEVVLAAGGLRPIAGEMREEVVTIWVDGTINGFRLRPMRNSPGTFRLSEIELLVPAAD